MSLNSFSIIFLGRLSVKIWTLPEWEWKKEERIQPLILHRYTSKPKYFRMRRRYLIKTLILGRRAVELRRWWLRHGQISRLALPTRSTEDSYEWVSTKTQLPQANRAPISRVVPARTHLTVPITSLLGRSTCTLLIPPREDIGELLDFESNFKGFELS